MKQDQMVQNEIKSLVDRVSSTIREVGRSVKPAIRIQEIGTIMSVGRGVARIKGLPGIQSEELVRLPANTYGIAFNLDPDEVALVLLDHGEALKAGQEVTRTGRVMDIPVTDGLLGRIIDGVGRALDNGASIEEQERYFLERDAPAIMDRAPVTIPLQTGIQAIDALIPIGRGQRELILGDRQTGKTAIAVDTIINQRETDVLCIYCAIGKRISSVASVIADLKEHGAMDHTIVVVATGEDAPGLNFVTPYAAMSIAEFFMAQGKDVLVVLDDLTQHARSYRELSLLLRRPPAREAYPGDIFYIHARLLERATHLRDQLGGGSITALPIIETQAENISAYIPTNLVSITDGQIYLSPQLFQQGVLPAVDVGMSVSRVGGKTQLPAYRMVAGDLRLSYSQFHELETFARFGTRLDEETKATLERGRRVREVLKQEQYHTISIPEQIGVLLAVTEGVFDRVRIENMGDAKKAVRQIMCDQFSDIGKKIIAGKEISAEDKKTILEKLQALFAEPGEE